MLQAQGIIALVTTLTEWCAPIIITPKKDIVDIRMCVDLSCLNWYVKCEHYIMSSTPAQVAADIAARNAKIFTKLDAQKCYHQCPLHEEIEPTIYSQHLLCSLEGSSTSITLWDLF